MNGYWLRGIKHKHIHVQACGHAHTLTCTHAQYYAYTCTCAQLHMHMCITHDHVHALARVHILWWCLRLYLYTHVNTTIYVTTSSCVHAWLCNRPYTGQWLIMCAHRIANPYIIYKCLRTHVCNHHVHAYTTTDGDIDVDHHMMLYSHTRTHTS